MPRRRRHPAYPLNQLAPLPEPLLQRQVRGDVQANVHPLIAQITAEINRRARAGGQNISGIANELAGKLGAYAPQQREIYGHAQESLGGVDKAIADRLAAAGQHDAADLGAKGGLSGLPSALVQSLASGAERTGAGAGASSFARGSAEVKALASRGAGAEDYAAKLPGLARLSGLQGVKELQAGAQRDLATQLDRVRSQTPSLIASSLRDARNREVTKGLGNLGYQGTIYRTQAQGGRTQAQIDAANARTAATIAGANQRATQSQSGQTARQRRAERGRNRRANASQINQNRRARMRKKAAANNPFGGG